MLHNTDQYLIARLQHHPAVAVRDKVQRLGRITGKDNLLRTLRIQEIPHHLHGRLLSLGRILRQVIQSTQRVGIAFLIKVRHCARTHSGRCEVAELSR